jgi:PST family polysaccharide transporter
MTLIKTSLLNAIAVVIKMLTMLGLNKILAIYVGPAGYAAIGQFQNAIQMITTFASGAINNGVTKYTAEYHDDETRQHMVWRTAGAISLVGSVIFAVFVIAFNQSVASWFLKDESMGSVFIWFAATLVLFVFNTLLLAILNGKKEIRRYVIANIAGSIFALLVTAIMTIKLGLYGALISLAVYQSLAFFVTLFITYKSPWFKFSYMVGAVDKKVAFNLFKYSMMVSVTAICGPTATIFIRDHIISSLGLDYAGYWEAMTRISSAYMMLFTAVLSVYFLPALAELKKTDAIKKEIFNGWKIIVPACFVLSVLIYLLRDYVIFILFTADFSPMESLFMWQMVGDVLRIAGWILAFIMLSKALTKLYIATEISFNLLHYFLIVAMVERFDFVGTSMAYAVVGLLYLLLMIYIFFFSSRYAFDRNPRIYE